MTQPVQTARPGVRRRWLRLGLCALVLAALGFAALPVVQFAEPYSAVVLDRNGQLLGARVAADEQWRFPPRETLPSRFATALLAAEDKRFRHHPGVDPVAVVRAMRLNLEAGHVVSGASTLTMQTIRIARHNPARTVPEKLWEMLLALRLEAAASKDEILAAYAAHAPFGGNTVGLEAAAWRYFGRSPRDLSWAEASALAVLPNAPSLVHPGRNRERLRQKRDTLLAVLAERGVLSPTDLQAARAEPLPAVPLPVPLLVPHLTARAQNGDRARRRVVTTLDREIQERVLQVLGRHHQRLAGARIHNLAALVAEVDSGEVLAYVGNAPGLQAATHGNYVDIVRARRSTGSLLKPMLYEAMLEVGELLPTELVPDVPMRMGGFAPVNFDKRYEGALPASLALARSRNVPAAWMLRRYGVQRFGDRLRALGMTTLHRASADYGLSLVLGGAEGTLWNLASLYRNLGRSVLEPDATEVPELHWRLGGGEPGRATSPDPAAAWLTLQALQQVNRPGVHGAWRSFDSSRRIAWKTGTSFGFRDGWAIGVDPNIVVAVWIGNHDGEGRPGLTGFEAAAPVLFDLFDLFENAGWFQEPAGLTQVEVCAYSGQRAGPDCPATRTRSVPPAALHSTGCSFCRRIHCDENCTQRIHAGCAGLDEMHSEPWFVLPAAQEWFYSRRHSDYRTLPPWRDGCAESGADSAAISMLYPRSGAEVYVPIELSGERGRVVFEAAHRDHTGRIYWHLDDDFVGTTEYIHQLALAPSPGDHRLTLVDSRGRRLVHHFAVLDPEG